MDEDFGGYIKSCILIIDNTALFVALYERLEKIKTGISGFDTHRAEQCVTGKYDTLKVDNNLQIDHDIDELKKKFIRYAISNNIQYLWGPPGTGKTHALSVLVYMLYGLGERVLVCSNTNQAVDQLLLKLCDLLNKREQKILSDGHVVRIGKITLGELNDRHGEWIRVEDIVKRKSKELHERKHAIDLELKPIADQKRRLNSILGDIAKDKSIAGEISSRSTGIEGLTHDVNFIKNNISEALSRRDKLQIEYQRRNNANALAKIFMRSETNIQNDQSAIATRIDEYTKQLNSVSTEVADAHARLVLLGQEQIALRRKLRGVQEQNVRMQLTSLDTKESEFRSELSDINGKLDAIQKAVVHEARIVGATVTRTYVSPDIFSTYTTVIVDEASMVMLPALYHAVGLANKRVVIVGDFRQLAPIIQTDQEAIAGTLGIDVFKMTGLDKQKADSDRMLMLREQRRMHPAICDLVSDLFYENKLKTAPEQASQLTKLADEKLPDILKNTLTIIDSSRVWPFVARDARKSRFNLMHAFIVRNLCIGLQESGFLKVGDKNRVGVCTPYVAQARLIHRILMAYKLTDSIEAGTVHRYQGDEKGVMIIDLTDSVGERNIGIFLQANHYDDAGAKLLNVAISRAKQHVIVLANLTYLNDRLPGDAYLRDILDKMQRTGKVIDADEILSLYPIWNDLSKAGYADIEQLDFSKGAADGKGFEKIIQHDLANAAKSIVFYSAFITEKRTAFYGDILRERINAGVKVRCITRPPNRNGSISEEESLRALNALEMIGVIIDLRDRIHEKAVIIDDQITWMGSLNPLSFTDNTDEIMGRVEDEETAQTIGALLSIKPTRGGTLEPGQLAIGENPRCPQCHGLTVYREGRYGPYFECLAKDGWTESVDKPKRRSRTGNSTNTRGRVAPTCPKCSKPMVIRNGRYGEFWGCSRYPACKGKQRI